MTRQQKTPQQRAEEALAIADRKVKRLTEQVALHRTELARLDKERDQAVVRREYLAQHPDLPRPEQAPKAEA